MIFGKVSEGKTTNDNELGFRFTRFCVFKETDYEKLFCAKCKEKIFQNSWVFICDDMNKLWHEKHFENWHDKRKFRTVADTQQHEDKLYFLKIAKDDDFENLGYDQIIELTI